MKRKKEHSQALVKKRRLNDDQLENKFEAQINATVKFLTNLPASTISHAIDSLTLKRLIRKLKNANAVQELNDSDTESSVEIVPTPQTKTVDWSESIIETLSKRGLPGLKIVDVGAVSYNELGHAVPNTCLGRSLIAASGRFSVEHPQFNREALNLLQIIGSAPGDVHQLIENGDLGAGKMYSNFWLEESMRYAISPLYTSCIWIVQEESTTLYVGPGYRPQEDQVLALYYSDHHYQILTGPDNVLLNVSAQFIKQVVDQEPKIYTIAPKIRPATSSD